MGCDIHSHIEIKIGGVWHHYSCPPLPRSYQLFERICGVRGEAENAIAPPRGLPDDLSIVTKVCRVYDGCDAHSETWLDQMELCALIKFHETFTKGMAQFDHWGYLNGNSFDLSTYGHPVEITDVRFICWFDN